MLQNSAPMRRSSPLLSSVFLALLQTPRDSSFWCCGRAQHWFPRILFLRKQLAFYRLAVPIPVLCEFVWVLRRGYKKSVSDISDAIHRLMNGVNVAMNRPAVEAGLSVLDAGGDFADGAIAYEGDWLGAEEFVSFDSKAISILQSQGSRVRLLS